MLSNEVAVRRTGGGLRNPAAGVRPGGRIAGRRHLALIIVRVGGVQVAGQGLAIADGIRDMLVGLEALAAHAARLRVAVHFDQLDRVDQAAVAGRELRVLHGHQAALGVGAGEGAVERVGVVHVAAQDLRAVGSVSPGDCLLNLPSGEQPQGDYSPTAQSCARCRSDCRRVQSRNSCNRIIGTCLHWAR